MLHRDVWCLLWFYVLFVHTFQHGNHVANLKSAIFKSFVALSCVVWNSLTCAKLCSALVGVMWPFHFPLSVTKSESWNHEEKLDFRNQVWQFKIWNLKSASTISFQKSSCCGGSKAESWNHSAKSAFRNQVDVADQKLKAEISVQNQLSEIRMAY